MCTFKFRGFCQVIFLLSAQFLRTSLRKMPEIYFYQKQQKLVFDSLTIYSPVFPIECFFLATNGRIQIVKRESDKSVINIGLQILDFKIQINIFLI